MCCCSVLFVVACCVVVDVSRCVLRVVCCWLFACCLLFVVWCFVMGVFGVWSPVRVACWLLPGLVACCSLLFFVVCWLLVAS